MAKGDSKGNSISNSDSKSVTGNDRRQQKQWTTTAATVMETATGSGNNDSNGDCLNGMAAMAVAWATAEAMAAPKVAATGSSNERWQQRWWLS